MSVNVTGLKMILRTEIALRWTCPGIVAKPPIADTVAELHITDTVVELALLSSCT